MRVKSFPLLFVIAISFLGGSLSVARDKLPRRYEGFELGKRYEELEPWLKLFQCKNIQSSSGEFILMGYPKRGDFLILKFYNGELVGIAHFVFGMNYEQRLVQLQKNLGKPSMPAYISDKAVSNMWKDEKTYITFTHLLDTECVIYEIRDISKEPLYRKAYEKTF